MTRALLPGLAAMLLIPALAACGDSQASAASAPAEAANASGEQAQSSASAAANGDVPRMGHCNLGTCHWYEVREEQVVGSSGEERLVRLTLASGRSTHAEDDFPPDASSASIVWSGTEQAFVFCSKRRPSVTRALSGGGWERVRIDLLDAPHEFQDGGLVIYGSVCHPGENWTVEDFFARQGYDPAPGEPVTRVRQPDAVTFADAPERGQGGMAVSSIPAPPAMSANLPAPAAAPIEVRPPAPPPPRAPRFELVVADEEGNLTEQRTFATMGGCQRARDAALAGGGSAVCVRH